MKKTATRAKKTLKTKKIRVLLISEIQFLPNLEGAPVVSFKCKVDSAKIKSVPPR
jgi:hypothetical protein